MEWIVSTGKDIAVDTEQLLFRHSYIEDVSSAPVSAWNYIRINGTVSKDFLCCTSCDNVNGAFITAHIGQVALLCTLAEIYNGDLVVANTCIWERYLHKKILYSMMRHNRKIELWFAKQEVSLDGSRLFRKSTTIANLGEFGFQTSLSERSLFRQRALGLRGAIEASFDRVSPILLLND